MKKLLILTVLCAVMLCLSSCCFYLEHQYTEMIASDDFLKSDATCTEPKTYYYSCICGVTGDKTFTVGEPKGHDLGEFTPDGNASCYGDGTKSAVCKACGKIVSTADEGSTTEHPFKNTYSYNETHHWYEPSCTHDTVKKDEEMHTFVDNICTYCGVDKPLAIIESVKDGVIYGADIAIGTKGNTYADAILDVVCSDGAMYQIYTDPECTNLLRLEDSLSVGDNTVYFRVETSADARIYTVRVHKSFKATVTFRVDGVVVKTEEFDTGFIYTPDYLPSAPVGYKLYHWLQDGSKYTPKQLFSDTVLDAVFGGKEYLVTFDGLGGNVSKPDMIVIYGEKFILPTPTKTDYSFEGWYDEDGNRVTDGIWLKDGGAALTVKWRENAGIGLPFIPIG